MLLLVRFNIMFVFKMWLKFMVVSNFGKLKVFFDVNWGRVKFLFLLVFWMVK